MGALKFFDSSTMILPKQTVSYCFPSTYTPLMGDASFRPVDKLLAEMRHVNITRALVFNGRSILLHPRYGDLELIEHVKGIKGLYPTWFLLPKVLRELPPLPQLLDEMEFYGVKAARMVPGPGGWGSTFTFGHGLEEWCVGSVLNALEDRGMPLFLGADETKISELCRNHPGLTVVWRGGNRVTIYPLLRKYENLYLSTRSLHRYRLLEEVVELIGADRIIFGTSYPTSPSCQVNQVMYADLTEAQKRRIASENLERILGGGVSEEIMPGEESSAVSEITDAARNGRKLSGFVSIDCHVHVGERAGFTVPPYGTEQLVKTMNAVGLSKACINHYWGLYGDMIEANTRVAQMVDEYPNRFIGVGIIDPNYDSKQVKAEIKRCVEDLGFTMIKIHPSSSCHGVSLLDPSYEPVWEGAEKYGYIILTHTTKKYEGSEAEPKHVDILAEKHPNIIFIMGHAGNNYIGLKESIEIAKKHKNVYLDISGNPAFTGRIELIVREVGVHKVLFGTDWDYFDLYWAMGSVLYAKLRDEEKKLILGGNIARLLKLKT